MEDGRLSAEQGVTTRHILYSIDVYDVYGAQEKGPPSTLVVVALLFIQNVQIVYKDIKSRICYYSI